MSWWDRLRSWLDTQPSEPRHELAEVHGVAQALEKENIRLHDQVRGLEADMMVRLAQVQALARELETCSIERARLRELLARTPFIRPPPT